LIIIIIFFSHFIYNFILINILQCQVFNFCLNVHLSPPLFDLIFYLRCFMSWSVRHVGTHFTVSHWLIWDANLWSTMLYELIVPTRRGTFYCVSHWLIRDVKPNAHLTNYPLSFLDRRQSWWWSYCSWI
jgi:hypothetical protein